MSTEHDTAFRALFAHPTIVRDLLEGFLPLAWSDGLRLETLERVNGSYVGDGGEQRHSDMVWRVRMSGEWLYLYVLLEFQSRPDHWMALRMQVYLGLLRAMSRRYRFKLDNLLVAVAALAYSPSNQQIRQLAQECKVWLAQDGCAEFRRAVEFWLQTRLPEGAARHTLEATPLVAIEEGNMADFRNGMPFFDTFAEQILWGQQQVGKQQIMEHLLRKRFGEIPSHYVPQLETAGPDEFEAWSERLLDGMSLEEIFVPLPDSDEEVCLL